MYTREWLSNNDNATQTITFQVFALSSLCGHNHTESMVHVRPGGTTGTSGQAFISGTVSCIVRFSGWTLRWSELIPNAVFRRSNFNGDRNRIFCIYKILTYVLVEAH